MIIVLDTNVLISGIINPSGPPGRIVNLLRTGEIDPALDDRILGEYIDVLHSPKLAKYFLEYLSNNSEMVIPEIPNISRLRNRRNSLLKRRPNL